MVASSCLPIGRPSRGDGKNNSFPPLIRLSSAKRIGDRQLVLLDVNDLHTVFQTEEGLVGAVDGVSFTLDDGQVLGLVGESGCGKSVTALSIMKLVASPPGRISSGHILFQDRDLVGLPEEELRKLRGNQISMIFQEPMTSLNPVFTIGDQIGEVFRVHRGYSKTAALDAAVDMLKQVGIPEPKRRVSEFPHQLSGGMRQRVMIAMALACRPRLMIADEPTTALDVTIQAQILALMNDLRREIGMAILLITHNLGVVAEMADHVAVMYAGQIVESASVMDLFNRPAHPYTLGLLRSLPPAPTDPPRDKLTAIDGLVPSLLHLPSGCRFHDRCPDVFDLCSLKAPELYDLGEGRSARCLKYEV
ncbi:MAG: ABC transporter ATP-binding protein [Deltaproteobacteria bacterium]|nr:ABC transporter ATP-binding protein [Deltaproteobacteria bacterium]